MSLLNPKRWSLIWFCLLQLFGPQGWSDSAQVTPLWNQRSSIQARIDSALDPENRRMDVLTFTLKEDEVGKSLLALALQVVRQGGQARIGYDAYSSKISPELITYMHHMGVEMRAFRPLKFSLRHFWELGLSKYFKYFNLRSHEKLYRTSKTAIVGSSNYTQDYFLISKDGQPDQKGRWNFLDRDLLIEGAPVLEEVDKDFEAKWRKKDFWEKPELVPLTGQQMVDLHKDFAVRIQALRTIRGAKPPGKDFSVDIEYISDSYGAVRKNRKIHRSILEMVEGSTKEIDIWTPYALLPEDLELALTKAQKRGVRVRIYTNHINGGDEGDVNAAFKADLLKLHKNNFEIFTNDAFYVFHGKVFVVDGESIYWGSYNFNNRSKRSDSENGVLIESQELAKEIKEDSRNTIFSQKKVVPEGPSSYRLISAAMEKSCKNIFAPRSTGETIQIPNTMRLRLLRPLM